MRLMLLLVSLAIFQSGGGDSKAIIVNSGEAKWTHDAGDPPGSESIVLREDPKTGAFEIFTRYPAGHVFSPHWHSANERIVLIEGRLAIGSGASKKTLDPGGFAFLPAREVQQMACVSQSRCGFYVAWDGKLDFNRPPVK